MFGEWWHSDLGLALTLILQCLLVAISISLTIHILLNKSDPKASLMWIALVWFTPIFGAVFYLLFGINRITRRAQRLIHNGAPESDNVIKQTDFDYADDAWIEFRRLGNHVTHSRRCRGNDVEILEGIETIHKAMIDAIKGADKTIVLSTYIFGRDDLGIALADALVSADQRGVDVKVLLDGVGNGFFRSKTFRQLRNGGVDVRRFLHSKWPWRMPLLNLRNHRKVLIIDDHTAFTGSMNIGRVRNLETHFKIEGGVTRQFMKAFEYDWVLAGGSKLPENFQGTFNKAVGTVAARGIASGPIYRRERLRWVILGALGAATKQIRVVTPYFIPDKGLLAGLVLAAFRGVQVDIILPKRSNYPFADWASYWQLKDLLRAGCNIYHRPDVFDHSKLMTVDGKWALIGSSNWDARSLRLNFEFDMECEDELFVAELDDVLMGRMQQSTLLNWDDFKNRTFFEKIRDASARLLLPYL